MLNFLQIKFLTTFSHRVTFFKQKCGEGKRIKNNETQRMNEKSEKKKNRIERHEWHECNENI